MIKRIAERGITGKGSDIFLPFGRDVQFPVCRLRVK